jgi:transcriptional regulator with XRE-family HTH domain
MPKHLKFASTAPVAVQVLARLLGSRLRIARQRRQFTLRELAARAGIAYDTARAVETGNVQTGLGAYLALAWALGLDDKFTMLLAPEDDAEGVALALARAPKRVRHATESDDEF